MQIVTVYYNYTDFDGTVRLDRRDVSYIQFLDEQGLKFQGYCHKRQRRKRDFDIIKMVSAQDTETGVWIDPRDLVKLIKNPYFKGLEIDGNYYGLEELCDAFRRDNPIEIQLIVDNIHKMDDSSLYHLSVTLRKYGAKRRAFADELDKIRTARDTEREIIVEREFGYKKSLIKKHDPVIFMGVTPDKTFAIKYQDGEGNITEREISNIELLDSERPQILAYCHLRNERRTFNLENIISLVDGETGEVIED